MKRFLIRLVGNFITVFIAMTVGVYIGLHAHDKQPRRHSTKHVHSSCGCDLISPFDLTTANLTA